VTSDLGPVSVDRKGFSMLETLLVVTLLALIVVAISPYFGSAFRAWQYVDRQSEVYERARVGMDRIIKALRQAQSVSSITAASETNGEIQLTDIDGETLGFRRNSSDGRLEYDPPGTPTGTAGAYDDLADSIASLTFTAYEDNGTSTTTTVADIRSVVVILAATDEANVAGSLTLRSRADIRLDVLSIEMVINEINYNPTFGGAGERRNEWIEIYNYGATDVDVSGWTLTDGTDTDSILGVDGTTIIPAGGYGVITADPTDVYTNYTVNASAIRLEIDDTRLGNGLSDNGETITINTASSSTVDAVTYDDAWGGDGDGDTIERVSATGGSSDSGNWEASSDTSGMTAGTTNTVTP